MRYRPINWHWHLHMCNRFDRIPAACDRQTDRQTSRDGLRRAMHTRRAVKIELFPTLWPRIEWRVFLIHVYTAPNKIWSILAFAFAFPTFALAKYTKPKIWRTCFLVHSTWGQNCTCVSIEASVISLPGTFYFNDVLQNWNSLSRRVVRYPRYIDIYRRYLRDDTSIAKVTVYRGIS